MEGDYQVPEASSVRHDSSSWRGASARGDSPERKAAKTVAATVRLRSFSSLQGRPSVVWDRKSKGSPSSGHTRLERIEIQQERRPRSSSEGSSFRLPSRLRRALYQRRPLLPDDLGKRIQEVYTCKGDGLEQLAAEISLAKIQGDEVDGRIRETASRLSVEVLSAFLKYRESRLSDHLPEKEGPPALTECLIHWAKQRIQRVATAQKRYARAESLFSDFESGKRNALDCFLQHLETRGRESLAAKPVVHLLLEIERYESEDDPALRSDISKSIFANFLAVGKEVSTGVVAKEGVYTLWQNSKFRQAVQTIERRIGLGYRRYKLFSRVKEIGLSYLQEMYFASTGPRAGHHFHSSQPFRRLCNFKPTYSSIPKKKSRKDHESLEERFKLIFQGEIPLLPITPGTPHTLESDALRATADLYLPVPWPRKSCAAPLKAFLDLIAQQIAMAISADQSDLRLSLQRLRRALRVAEEFAQQSHETEYADRLYDLQLLVAPNLDIPISIEEFFRRWECELSEETRDVLRGLVLGEPLFSRLMELRAWSQSGLLRQAARVYLKDKVTCLNARQVLAPPPTTTSPPAKQETKWLHHLAALMASRGDHRANASLQFLRAIKEEWLGSPDTSTAKALYHRYLAFEEELESGHLCESGLYHLSGREFCDRVTNLKRYFDGEEAPEPGYAFATLYRLAFDYLEKSWLSDTPPIPVRECSLAMDLPEDREEGSRATAHLIALLRKMGPPVALEAFNDVAKGMADECLRLPTRIDHLESDGDFLQAKAEQITSRTFFESHETIRELCDRLACAKNLVLRECAKRGKSSKSAQSLLEVIEAFCTRAEGSFDEPSKIAGELLEVLRAIPSKVTSQAALVIQQRLMGPGLSEWLERLASPDFRARLQDEVREWLRARLTYHMVREALRSKHEPGALQRRYLDAWTALLRSEGDLEAIRMSAFLLQVSRKACRTWHKAALAIWDQFFELSAKRGEDAALGSTLYRLWNEQPGEVRAIRAALRKRRIPKGLYSQLATAVENTVWSRYPIERVSTLLLRPNPPPRLSKIRASSSKSAGIHVEQMKQRLEPLREAASDWRQRLVELVSSSIAVPNRLSIKKEQALVRSKTAEIVGIVDEHHLGLDRIVAWRCVRALEILTPWIQRKKRRVAPLVKATYEALWAVLEGAEDGGSTLNAVINMGRTSQLALRRSVLGSDLFEGIHTVASKPDLEKVIAEAVTDYVQLAFTRRHPHLHVLPENELLKLQSLVTHIAWPEVTRSLVPGGELNLESIVVTTKGGGSVWQLESDTFEVLCEEGECEGKEDRIQLFYSELFSALAKRSGNRKGRAKRLPAKEAARLFVKRLATASKVARESRPGQLALLRPSLPWIDALLAVTAGPWAIIREILAREYPKTFPTKGFSRASSDPELRARVRFILDDDNQQVTACFARPYATCAKERGGVLFKFDVQARYTFNWEGNLVDVTLEVANQRLSSHWLNLRKAHHLAEEHYRKSIEHQDWVIPE